MFRHIEFEGGCYCICGACPTLVRLEAKAPFSLLYKEALVSILIKLLNTRASLYRRERGALASNLTNVGQAPHIH